jgi:hypothetical protein
MGLRIFETKEAKYFLGLGWHYGSSLDCFEGVDFSRLDMFVFEDCGMEWGVEHWLKYHEQYMDIYKRILKENPKLKIYGVDVRTSELAHIGSIAKDSAMLVGGSVLAISGGAGLLKGKESRRGFLANLLRATGGFALTTPIVSGLNCFLGNDDLGVITDTANVIRDVTPTPAHEFRDAVTAKKVSKYLVPLNKKKKRKLKVALLYGAYHSTIETKLKRPWVADATIGLYHNTFDYKTKKELNQIREVRINKGELETIIHECKLF